MGRLDWRPNMSLSMSELISVSGDADYFIFCVREQALKSWSSEIEYAALLVHIRESVEI